MKLEKMRLLLAVLKMSDDAASPESTVGERLYCVGSIPFTVIEVELQGA